MKLGMYHVEFHHNLKEQKTLCIIQNSKKRLLRVSEAHCSKKDCFNKAIGRKVSLTRAIVTLSKENRTRVWDDFKARMHIK